MTKTTVNAANVVWGATTRPSLAHEGGMNRSLCVDSGSQQHRVMPRGGGESSRTKSFHCATLNSTTSMHIMKKILLILILAALAVAKTFAAPLGSTFTYQGRLNQGGSPANNLYDLTFTLHDDPTNAATIGNSVVLSAVPVTNGYFTVQINTNAEFGTTAFDGSARWLQINVRTNGGAAFIPLTPRQPLTPSPLALFSSAAGAAQSAGQLQVNGTPAVRLQSTTDTPDVIGGFTGNTVAPGLAGVTIAGGGTALGNQPNVATGNGQYATISGGYRNTVSGYGGVVSGGSVNSATGNFAGIGAGQFHSGSGAYSWIGGGYANTNQGALGTIGGGQFNVVGQDYAGIGGGHEHHSLGYNSWIGGGWSNTATVFDSTVGGGRLNQAIAGNTTVGGGD